MEQGENLKQFNGFFGNYQHSLDVKGRVFIPSKYRDDLTSGFVLTKWLDKCLAIYPRSEWEMITEKLKKIPFTDKAGRDFVRFFLGNATECEMDKQGRIGVTLELRNYANLDRDVIFAGAMNYIELWDQGCWKNNSSEYDGNADTLAEKMQKYLGLGESD